MQGVLPANQRKKLKRMKILTKGNLFIISGPSGAGKSTVLSKVFSQLGDYYFSISMTTRAPRAGEQHGKDYLFTDRETFEKNIAENGLLEYVEYVGNYYGTPVKPITDNLAAGRDVFLDVEVVGHGSVVERMPEAKSIFIMPPSADELEKRLRGRKSGESEETISNRLKRAKEEIKLAAEYDYIVVNDDADRAAQEMLSIILKEKSKKTEE